MARQWWRATSGRRLLGQARTGGTQARRPRRPPRRTCSQSLTTASGPSTRACPESAGRGAIATRDDDRDETEPASAARSRARNARRRRALPPSTARTSQTSPNRVPSTSRRSDGRTAASRPSPVACAPSSPIHASDASTSSSGHARHRPPDRGADPGGASREDPGEHHGAADAEQDQQEVHEPHDRERADRPFRASIGVEHLRGNSGRIRTRLADVEHERAVHRVRVGRDHPPGHRVGALRQDVPAAQPRPRRPAGGSPRRRRPASRCRHRRASSRAPSRSARRSAAAPDRAQPRPPRRSTASSRATSRGRTRIGTIASATTATTIATRSARPATRCRGGNTSLLRLSKQTARRSRAALRVSAKEAGGPRVPKPSASAGNRGASTRRRGTRTSADPRRTLGHSNRRPTARAARSSSQATPKAARAKGICNASPTTNVGCRQHPKRECAVMREPLEQLLASEDERRHQPEMPSPQSTRNIRAVMTRLRNECETDHNRAESKRQRQIGHVLVASLRQQVSPIVRVRRQDPIVSRMSDLRTNYRERDCHKPG